jgi:hypothetical protein
MEVIIKQIELRGNMKNIFLILILIFTLSSCDKLKDSKELQIQKKYLESLTVLARNTYPDDWKTEEVVEFTKQLTLEGATHYYNSKPSYYDSKKKGNQRYYSSPYISREKDIISSLKMLAYSNLEQSQSLLDNMWSDFTNNLNCDGKKYSRGDVVRKPGEWLYNMINEECYTNLAGMNKFIIFGTQNEKKKLDPNYLFWNRSLPEKSWVTDKHINEFNKVLLENFKKYKKNNLVCDFLENVSNDNDQILLVDDYSHFCRTGNFRERSISEPLKSLGYSCKNHVGSFSDLDNNPKRKDEVQKNYLSKPLLDLVTQKSIKYSPSWEECYDESKLDLLSFISRIDSYKALSYGQIMSQKPETDVLLYGEIQQIIDNGDKGTGLIIWYKTVPPRVLYNTKSSKIYFKKGDRILAWGKFKEKLEGMGVVDLIVYDTGTWAMPYVKSDRYDDFKVNPSQLLLNYYSKLLQ